MRITPRAHRKITFFTFRGVMGPVGICLLITVVASFAVASVLAADVTPYIPVLTGYADCITDCAIQHPELGEDYDACVALCDELWLRQGGTPDSGGLTALSPSVQQSPEERALFQEAIAAAVIIQQMRENGADPIRVVNALEAFFATQWNDRRLRASLVDPFFVRCVREMAQGDLIDMEAEALHDMLLGVAGSDYLGSVSQIGRGCVLALGLWLAETTEERAAVLRTSARYDLVEVVTILADILSEDCMRGASGSDDAEANNIRQASDKPDEVKALDVESAAANRNGEGQK